MPSRTILSIAFGVVVFAVVLFAGWRRDEATQFEAQFQSGGDVTLDLSAGGYTIKGTAENKIRVEVNPFETRYVRSSITVNGNHARISIDGPTDNLDATIYVPQRSDIKVNQTLGELRVMDIEGNKDLGLNIGKIWVDVADPARVKSVYAEVKIGNVSAQPWHRGQGGFFRTFRAGGQGPYSVRASLDIGDIELSD
jgi:hypothetical protein